MISRLQLDSSYKFMELTPELLNIIQENKEKLYLKSPNGEADVVLCTSSKTYKIRQRNHSNTVLVMKEKIADNTDENAQLIGYASLPSVFECHSVGPSIDTSGIPIYDGITEMNLSESLTIDELKQRSAISEQEFDKIWFDSNGSSFNDYAILLDEAFISKTLHLLIMSITAADLDLDEMSIIEVYNSIKEEAPSFTIDIVESVLRKFSSNEKEPLKIDRVKVSQWYGIQSLRRNCSRRSLSLSEFQIKWKSELPPFFESPIDVALLKGSYYSPLPEKIQYISKDTLPNDINGRLKQLFKLQSTWDLNQLIPFIEEFNNKDLKWENFIMKFAKRKKIGKRFLITQK